jgi:hypothetical protein
MAAIARRTWSHSFGFVSRRQADLQAPVWANIYAKRGAARNCDTSGTSTKSE